MLDLDYIKTFAANAAHAAFNHERVSIGGGKFNSEEISSVATALKSFESMAQALNEISEMLSKHPEFERGNSVVHYCAHKAKSACPQLVAPPEEIDQARPRPQ